MTAVDSVKMSLNLEKRERKLFCSSFNVENAISTPERKTRRSKETLAGEAARSKDTRTNDGL